MTPQILTVALALLIFAIPHSAPAQSSAPPAPTNGAGAFATHHYRNLFAESGHSKKEISAKINAAYKQLFHGDAQTQSVFFYAGKNVNGPLAYVTD